MTIPEKVIRLAAIGVTVCLLVAALLYFSQEKRIEPEPFKDSELKRLGDPSELRPHIRRLVDALRAGELLGGPVDAFRPDLELADEARKGKQTSTYVFYAHPEAGDQEGHPVLYLVAQNKFGHIFRVGVGVPEW